MINQVSPSANKIFAEKFVLTNQYLKLVHKVSNQPKKKRKNVFLKKLWVQV